MADEKDDEDMENVSMALTRAKEHGLECEVILWSIYAMRSNPTISITEALNHGLDEWDV